MVGNIPKKQEMLCEEKIAWKNSRNLLYNVCWKTSQRLIWPHSSWAFSCSLVSQGELFSPPSPPLSPPKINFLSSSLMNLKLCIDITFSKQFSKMFKKNFLFFNFRWCWHFLIMLSISLRIQDLTFNK